MAEPPETAPFPIQVITYQWGYHFIYPGPDGEIGKFALRNATEESPIGRDLTDPKGKDDRVETELTLPLDREVELRILSKDVLHGIFIPTFRVSMDAVPGMDTKFKFTPDKKVDFEVACNVVCGRGYYEHRCKGTVLESEAFENWLKSGK